MRVLLLSLVVSVLGIQYLEAVDCSPGTFSATGEEPCTSCAAGKFTGSSGATTCDSCSPGRFQPEEGKSSCIDCTPGSVQPLEGQTTCVACEQNKFAASSGSTTCLTCVGGTFSGPGANICVADLDADACAAGRYDDGSDCDSSCPPGTSSAAGDDYCTVCAAGSFTEFTESSTCQFCPDGNSTFGAIGSTTCYACSVGTYAESGDANCTDCSPGTASEATESETCDDCEEDFFSSSAGSSVCTACASGFEAEAGSSVCTAVGSDSSDTTTTPAASSSDSCQVQMSQEAENNWGFWFSLALILAAFSVIRIFFVKPS